MKLKLEKMSSDERSFMLNHTKNFGLTMRTLINYNRSVITESIDAYIEHDDYLPYYKRFLNICRKYDLTDLSHEYKKIVNNEFDTKGSIAYTINLVANMIKKVKDVNARHEFSVLFLDVFSIMAIAYDIMDKSTSDFNTSSLSNLFEMLTKYNDVRYVSNIIYLIILCVHRSDDEEFINNMFFIACNYHMFNKDKCAKLVKNLMTGTTDVMDTINDIQISCVPSIDDLNVNDSFKGQENYDKTKISLRTRQGDMMNGDNLIEGLSVDDLLREIKALDDETIKDYIGTDNSIDTAITEKEIGYLKLRENVKTLKGIVNHKFYTLINYQGTCYLLFHIESDNKCYGISLPYQEGGERKIVSFDIPENLDYKFEL